MKKAMPRVYFGFDAESRPGEHIFLSYSRGDAGRIKGIASELHGMGLPIWYDDGLIPGNRWESEILNNVIQSKMTVFFLSKELFKRDKAYMIDEFQFAKDYNKPALCIWLDDIGKMDCTSLSQDMYLWWKELKRIHSIEVFHLKTDGDKAKEIFEGICRRDSGFRKYAAPAPKPEPVPARQPQPAPVSQPQPVVTSKPDAAPVLKDSEPKPTKPDVKPTTVKRPPLIITVAVVLVMAILGSVWAVVSSSSGKPKTGIDGSSSDTYSSDIYEFSSDTVSSEIPVLSQLTTISVGDHFTFGNYLQGSNEEVEPIEWRVLAVENGKALVISEKLLDCVQYNEKYVNVTWETCTLRKWMNGEFINKAFSSSEQAKIATVTNQNLDNPEYNTEGGNATQDKIFALSIDEANQYFSNDDDRMAAPTGYAKKQGAYVSDSYSLTSGEKTGWWWLRSPGRNGDLAASVDGDGDIYLYGDYVGNNYVAVRPAFWLNL